VYSEEQRVLDYRATFGSEHGARVLADLVSKGHVLESTLVPEPHIFAFREGERNMILEILRMLSLKPDQVRKVVEDVQETFA